MSVLLRVGVLGWAIAASAAGLGALQRPDSNCNDVSANAAATQ